MRSLSSVGALEDTCCDEETKPWPSPPSSLGGAEQRRRWSGRGGGEQAALQQAAGDRIQGSAPVPLGVPEVVLGHQLPHGVGMRVVLLEPGALRGEVVVAD